MSTGIAVSEPLLLSVVQLAQLLGVSVRHVWRLRDAGSMPAPIKLGKLIRWRKVAIERWLAECNTPRR